MKRKVTLSVISLLLVLFLLPLWAEEPVDLGMINRIRDEGFHRSQVMDTAFHLTDVLGPRLTGSPEQVAGAARAYHVYYQKAGEGAAYNVDHSTFTYLMNPKGRFACVIAYNASPQQVADHVHAAMAQGSGAESC